jgi:SnoaL-like domain
MEEDNKTLAARIERLESIDAIRQLASRYALALDTHHLDLLVECFVPDVRVGSSHGRHALKRDFDRRLRGRGYRINTHFVGNHVIEFTDEDHAIGVVYCRAEHEFPDQLVVGPMQYFDEYERQDGRWYFRRRRPLPWYYTDVLDRPVGPRRVRWPATEPAEAPLPGWWRSWSEFWSDPDLADVPPADAGPDETFLRRLRGQ